MTMSFSAIVALVALTSNPEFKWEPLPEVAGLRPVGFLRGSRSVVGQSRETFRVGWPAESNELSSDSALLFGLSGSFVVKKEGQQPPLPGQPKLGGEGWWSGADLKNRTTYETWIADGASLRRYRGLFNVLAQLTDGSFLANAFAESKPERAYLTRLTSDGKSVPLPLPTGYENFIANRASATGLVFGSLIGHNQSSVDTLFRIPFSTGGGAIFHPHRAAIYKEQVFLELPEPSEAQKKVSWATQAVGAVGDAYVGNLYVQPVPDQPITHSVVLWQGKSVVDVRQVTSGVPSRLDFLEVLDASIAGDLLVRYRGANDVAGHAILRRML